MIEKFDGKIKLIKKVDEGGVAEIWEANNPAADDILAFKCIKYHSPENIKIVQDEFRFLKLHEHPGIVRVFQYINTSELTGFLMEYLQGGKLAQSCGKLALDALLKVILEILEIANFVYHCGYIYNDYKPQNFIFDETGDLKLIDFNLIRSENDRSIKKSGTLGYLSPEALTGQLSLPQSDIYSLGVTFYELATGRMPFAAADIDSLIKQITRSEPESPLTSNKTLDEVILAMISPDPEKRPVNPFDVCARLGMEDQFKRKVKRNAGFYLGAGMENLKGIKNRDIGESADDPVEFVRGLLKKNRVDNDFIDRLIHITEGSPEVIHEYMEYFIELDIFAFGLNGWEVLSRLDSSIIPEKVGAIYRRHFEHYPESIQNLLKWLAVLGTPQPAGLLGYLTESDLSALDKNLGLLLNEGIIKKESGEYFMAGESRKNSIYAGLTEDQQKLYHARAAFHFEKYYPDRTGDLARHFLKAGDYEKAIDYNYKAALKLYQDFDYKKAREYIDDTERAFEKIEDNERFYGRLINVYMLAGDIAKAVGDSLLTENRYKKAAFYAEQMKSEKSLALAYKNLGDLYRVQQKSKESIRFSEKALYLYQKVDDLPCQAACYNNLGLACWTEGKYDNALKNFEMALTINEKLNNLNEQAKIYNNIGIIYDIMGRTGEVLSKFSHALECARQVKNRHSEAKCLDNIGFFYLNSGNPRKSLEYLDQGYKLAESMGNVEEQLNSLSNMAGAYYKMGNFIESAQACQKTLEIARALSHGLFQAQACHLLAKDCLAMGNFKLAFQMLSEAKNICNDLSNSELNVDILQTGIELELNCGDIDAARNLLAQVGESHSLTPYQELKKLWLEAIMAQAEKDKRSGELFKSLSERLKKTSHVELTGQSILGLAKSCSESPDFAKAKEYLREFDNLEISDLLLRLEVDLLRLELLVYECKYDEALGLAKKIKVQADQSGCSLVMFAAMVRETEIYSRCGKASLKEKSLRQAEKIRRSLVAAFPEEKDIKLFENIPAFGLYKRISGGKEKEIAKP